MIFRQSNSPIITHIQVSIVKCNGCELLRVYYYETYFVNILL